MEWGTYNGRIYHPGEELQNPDLSSSKTNAHLSLSGLKCESVIVHLPGFPTIDLMIFILLGDAKRRPKRPGPGTWGGSEGGREVVS